MNNTTAQARAVVTALLEHGVREVVVAPGSRNAPLAFAVWDAAEAGLLRLHTRVDERSAAFLALGLTRVGSRAAVICTSGTAVANLHPAVLEAAHAGVGLVAITADRPSRLHGTTANQTTAQVGIFGPLVDTVVVDAAPHAGWQQALATGSVVHLNVLLEEPLVPTEPWHPEPPAARSVGPWEEGVGERLPAGPRTVVVAGDDAGPPARVLAESGHYPLLAEPTSGSRTGHTPARTYRMLLGTDLGDRVERVVVAGRPTLSRPITRLLERPDVEVLDLGTRGVWSARPFPARRLASARPEVEPGDPAWLRAWQEADRAVGRQLDRLLAGETGLTAYEVAGAVARAVPPGGLLHVGASNPIRDLDLMLEGYAVGDRRKLVANRGLAGIDGVVSSAIGAALGRPRSTRALALVGDVTFLHDSNGLVLGPDEPRPDLTIVVVNDDGGSIFATLEQGAPAHADRFERLFATPHHVDLASLCAATRTPHWRVDSLPELTQALASPNGGIEVVEARVGRTDRRDLDARIRALRP